MRHARNRIVFPFLLPSSLSPPAGIPLVFLVRPASRQPWRSMTSNPAVGRSFPV